MVKKPLLRSFVIVFIQLDARHFKPHVVACDANRAAAEVRVKNLISRLRVVRNSKLNLQSPSPARGRRV